MRSIVFRSMALLILLSVVPVPSAAAAVPNCNVPNPPKICEDGAGDDRGDPSGYLDQVGGGAGELHIQGWAADPDRRSPISVNIHVDDVFVRSVVADLPRPDVAEKFPIFGESHGFDVTVPATKGERRVCIHAINVGQGANRFLGCKSHKVPGAPDSPTDLVLGSDDSYVAVAWHDMAVDEDGYALERSQAEEGPWTRVKTFGAIEPTPQGLPQRGAYVDQEVSPSNRYCYRVTAYNVHGEGARIACITTAKPPVAAPTDLTVGATTSDSVSLRWTENATDEDTVIFLVDMTKEKTGRVLRTVSLGMHPATGEMAYTATRLRPRTAYCFKVAAQKSGHSDADSNKVCAETRPR